MNAVVVGAGPVGLTNALFLSRLGYTVTVYEAKESLIVSEEESYPLGLNNRGMKTMKEIGEELVSELDRGQKISGFKVASGTRTRYTSRTNTITMVTRPQIVGILHELAIRDENISIQFGCRLLSINRISQELWFSGKDGGFVVRADQVFGCDGVNSAVRNALASSSSDFNPDLYPWGIHFRLLFMKTTPEDLDRNFHFIMGGGKYYFAPYGKNEWVLVLVIKEDSEEQDFLLGREATVDNINLLRSYLAKGLQDGVMSQLSDAELKAYFSRRSFTGAVVKVSRLIDDEWLVLLGDSAHSVIPAAGEGINSGLEDCLILYQCLKENIQNGFKLYNERRLADSRAVSEIGRTRLLAINGNIHQQFTFYVTQALLQIAKKLHIIDSSMDDYRVGKKAVNEIHPYRKLFEIEARQTRWLYPIVNAFSKFIFIRKSIAEVFNPTGYINHSKEQDV